MVDQVSAKPYINPVSGFTKLFSSLIFSTVWREEMHVKIVWITMLAMANRNGEVLSSLPGLADAARVTRKQCEHALRRLAKPDRDSRTKDHEGRRIEAVDGGWRLLNYLKYRELRDADERRIQTREAVRRYREKMKAEGMTVSHGKPRQAQAEAEAEAEAEKSTSGPAAPNGRPTLDEKGERAPFYAVLRDTAYAPDGQPPLQFGVPYNAGREWSIYRGLRDTYHPDDILDALRGVRAVADLTLSLPEADTPWLRVGEKFTLRFLRDTRWGNRPLLDVARDVWRRGPR